jgi:hypothetical protein
VGLPLLLATADLLAYLLAGLRSGLIWREAWLLVALVTVLLVSAIFWGTALIASAAFDLSIFRGWVLFVLLIFLTIVLYGLWADWIQARLLLGAYGGVVLLLATLSSSWHLNQRLERDEPDGFLVETTDPELRRLTSDIQTLSAQRMGDATQMPLLVQIGSAEGARPDPVLGWYFRNLRNLQWVVAPEVETAPGAQAPLVLTLGESADDSELAGYMGSRYTIRSRWLPTALLSMEVAPAPTGLGPLDRLSQAWSAWLRDLLRWMLYRKVNSLPPSESAVLWVKSSE